MIEKVLTGGFVKIPVEPGWRRSSSHMFNEVINNISDVVKFLSNSHKLARQYDDINELIGDLPTLDIDDRCLETEEIYEYHIPDENNVLKRPYRYENLYEAIEHHCGYIPVRDPIYVCKAKNSIKCTNEFTEVVEFFYENYKDFSCEGLNTEELSYLDQVRFYIFNNIISG